ncbi:hypothetical protein FVE85_6433 [Porphyridium purpureum]|uniref:Radical SAM core domain-containing protein n=1 Tax=Porphyridium purpureum TaxID=35688 RepID=A0A5J4Z6K4_PORPP|nr:hypothetical protein FVE85_6433 [Porphyridium purpureum]|eukprot:POR7578..scf295_1
MAIRKGLTYTLFGNVYVALTNASNCGVTMLAANGPRFEFPPGTGFTPLSPLSYEPSGEEAAAAAIEACRALDAQEHEQMQTNKLTSSCRQVVFAGLGEPMMRLQAMCDAMRILRARTEHVHSLRLNTNGLIQDKQSAARQLAAAGLSNACVQIQSADPEQHRELTRPWDTTLGLKDAVEFAQRLQEHGVSVECSIIARPEVDIAAAEALAKSIGCSFKARPYFA